MVNVKFAFTWLAKLKKAAHPVHKMESRFLFIGFGFSKNTKIITTIWHIFYIVTVIYVLYLINIVRQKYLTFIT